MKKITQENIDTIIKDILQSDIPSKIAQGVTSYLNGAFSKLPAIEETVEPTKLEVKPE